MLMGLGACSISEPNPETGAMVMTCVDPVTPVPETIAPVPVVVPATAGLSTPMLLAIAAAVAFVLFGGR